MSKAQILKPESPYLAQRIPSQIFKSLDTSFESSWCLPIPEASYPYHPSEYTLTLNTDESMEVFAELPTPSNIRGFNDQDEELSPIKVSKR